jgi:molybdenum cofactor synthesis domain-containing protein
MKNNPSDQKKAPTAIILVIGSEILSGRTLDTNSNYVARRLFARGIDVIRCLTIPDDIPVMVEEIRNNSSKCDYLFSMGGIGSTPDDLTRQAFALAFDVPMVRNPEAERIIREFAKHRVNESRLRMADLPDGCELIQNPFFGAPGFIIKNCYVFPGIPELLKAMFEIIEPQLPNLDKFIKTIKTNIREGDFADMMEEIQAEYPDVKIGSYPAMSNPEYKVELTFSGSDESLVSHAEEKFRKFLEGIKVDY